MPTPFTISLSPNYKPTQAKHRKWAGNVIGNGESFPRIFGSNIQSASDFYTLGIIPTFVLTAPATGGGSSTAGTYGIVLVYRSSIWNDGLSGDDIQGNGSNIVDVTLTSAQSVVLTKVTTADTKVDLLDVYAAIKIQGIYGAFYRVVKDGTNTAGTITFNVQFSNASGFLVGSGVTGGTLDDQGLLLATDNDFPIAQPYIGEVNGRMISVGGIVKRVTATATNGSPTIITLDTVYDGIQFWFFKLDSDNSGGIDGKGTYLVRYSTANSVVIVNADGTSANYTGATKTDTASIFTAPNRRFSKLLNPHSFPIENTSDDYPSALLAFGKLPNTNRVLLMGVDFVITEDYDRIPIQAGLNYISTEYGCSSHFSIVQAHGRLWWLDFGRNKRNILTSDGSIVTPISTQKIRNLLNRLTLDENGDPWRILFIHGAYYKDEEVIRWAIYLDNGTVANFILELDLITGDVRSDPQFYPHRYLDVFTYGAIRGRVYIGQFGWTGGIARLGLDNVQDRYRDWVGNSGTVSGTLATAGQTVTVLTIAAGALITTGIGLKGIQVLIWRETDANGVLIANRTYYHCRISDNTATTFTINYVESMNVAGEVPDVSNTLPVLPSGSGWQFRIGVIQAIVGPKWFPHQDPRIKGTFRDITLLHKGQDVTTANPMLALGFENFDNQPRDVQAITALQAGQQVANTAKTGSSFNFPKTNPVDIHGFAVHDNNVATDDVVGMNIEAIVLNYNEATEQGKG